jgi:hypothetical protein
MIGPALKPAAPPTTRKPAATAPPCAQCGSPNTEPLATMRLCTSDADAWYQCDECQYVFSASRRGDD